MPYECTTCKNRFRYKISLRTHKCVGPSSSTQAAAHLPSNPTTDEGNSVLNCPKALDDFVNESYNRMGIIDSIDFQQLNMNEHKERANCNENISTIFQENAIADIDSVCLPQISDLFEPPTLDEIHELIIASNENPKDHNS